MIGSKDKYMNYTLTYMDDLTKIQGAIPSLEKLKKSSFLITGATGLVCSAIVDFLLNLNDTCQVRNTVYLTARSRQKAEERFGERMDRPDVVFLEYDALEEVSWDFDVDYIIHGASPANPVLYNKHPVETMLTNFIGMNNLLLYARKHEVKRTLFVSSSEVYGKKNGAEPYGDNEYGYVDILDPRACYPCAKRACETLCVSYQTEYALDTVVVRLGHVYGPTATREDKRASSQFFFDVLEGNDIIMKSSGAQLRSYIYVPDCVSAIITVLINGKPGSAYNISNPVSIVTIRELAEQIARSSGTRIVFEYPSDEERKGYNLMDNSSLDSANLLLLGWQGMFSLSDGVKHTLETLAGGVTNAKII